MKSVAVIGGGLIGRGWSMLFAQAGIEVRMWDAAAGALESARAAIVDNLKMLHGEALIEDASVLVGRIRYCASLEDALEGVSYVQESIVENLEAKHALFRAMGDITDKSVILASSCSSIPPEDFMTGVAFPERALIAHPFSPPHLIPLVEIVATRWTDKGVIEETKRFMREIGQSPVMIKKPVVGFAVNRLQAAVINEALLLVGDGVIEPEDLDLCMSQGLGLRWAFMGPFETMDLNAAKGFGEYLSKYGSLYRALLDDMSTERPWAEAAIEDVEAWRRGAFADEAAVAERRLWRDRNLARLGKLFRGPRLGSNTP